MSDPRLTDCPQCNQATFKKQLTAAGFQLKGSGWYVTDFRDNGKKTAAPATADAAKEGGALAAAVPPAGTATPAAAAGAPAAAPAPTAAVSTPAASPPTVSSNTPSKT